MKGVFAMMHFRASRLAIVFGALASLTTSARATDTGDPIKGKQAFQGCSVCHSLTPNHNMTGPSLAGVIGRKAGSLASFQRYSRAIKASGVVWGRHSLDKWLTSPAKFIPGTRMTFPGIPDKQVRLDLIAYLNQATVTKKSHRGPAAGAPGDHDLKKLPPPHRVTSITYCPDTYTITTADGHKVQFWERNLRFQTDSSVIGPVKGAPAIYGAGMQGDRASVIFSMPEEISNFIKRRC